MNGILITDKPPGLTSADVVRHIKRRVKVKVGHLGTLDPFASGILPLCLGEATKIAQFLSVADKAYSGVIQLGTATDTGDPTGTVTETVPVPEIDASVIASVTRQFTGQLQQMPPMYSALKREGVPLYRLARRGIEVEREARSIHIATLHLSACADAQLRFELSCSKGTYVRVLAEDIGRALGTVAHLHTLRRTRFGSFDLSEAVDPTTWDPAGPYLPLSMRRALAHLPCVQLDPRTVIAMQRGQGWELARALAHIDASQALLVDSSGDAVAVVERREGRWQFARVLQGPQTLHDGARMVGTHSK